ncbi:SRPBCC family protein [Phormidium tenue FACHB-886]|nr:SRPBCC family protein [Phormidium tenue FACHB-886]
MEQMQNKTSSSQSPASGKGIRVQKTVTIDKPAETLYQFWRNFENLPTFMRHLKSVNIINDTRSHWVADAPLGQHVEWDADITNDQPNQAIAWTATANADVDHTGSVEFRPAPAGRGTEVRVVMDYTPPGGIIGAALAKLVGKAPEQQIGDELARFKMLMEAGEIATTDGQPKGG